MQHDTISLKRRQLMIAGIAGVSLPAFAFAGQSGGAPQVAPAATDLYSGDSGREGGLVVSGRIVGPDGKPRTGAAVEAWQANAHGEATTHASSITDGDGRFVISLTAPAAGSGRPQQIYYRVSHQGHATPVTPLHFARARGAAADRLAQLQRDESGIWRTTFGLTLA